MLAHDREEDFYPYHEDKVTESDDHYVAIQYLVMAFRLHLANRPADWAFANMFVYDQEGNRNRKVSPDVYVCFGSGQHSRKVFRTWHDGGPPVAVFEVTSRSSRRTDQTTKRKRYEEMGVQEYYLFDPHEEYIPGQLRVFRREGSELVPVLTEKRHRSEFLGVELVVEGPMLRVIDLASDTPYPTLAESWAENVRLKAENKRLRGSS
jgi:Uma2 family endonuclease